MLYFVHLPSSSYAVSFSSDTGVLTVEADPTKLLELRPEKLLVSYTESLSIQPETVMDELEYLSGKLTREWEGVRCILITEISVSQNHFSVTFSGYSDHHHRFVYDLTSEPLKHFNLLYDYCIKLVADELSPDLMQYLAFSEFHYDLQIGIMKLKLRALKKESVPAITSSFV